MYFIIKRIIILILYSIFKNIFIKTEQLFGFYPPKHTRPNKSEYRLPIPITDTDTEIRTKKNPHRNVGSSLNVLLIKISTTTYFTIGIISSPWNFPINKPIPLGEIIVKSKESFTTV